MISNYQKLKLDEYTRSNIVQTVTGLDETKEETENALVELAALQAGTETNIADIENALIEIAELIGGIING